MTTDFINRFMQEVQLNLTWSGWVLLALIAADFIVRLLIARREGKSFGGVIRKKGFQKNWDTNGGGAGGAAFIFKKYSALGGYPAGRLSKAAEKPKGQPPPIVRLSKRERRR
jgi:hypothetical protein